MLLSSTSLVPCQVSERCLQLQPRFCQVAGEPTRESVRAAATISKIPAPIEIKVALPNPKPKTNKKDPLPKRRYFMSMEVFQQKEPPPQKKKKTRRPKKIDAAISGPRIGGGKITDIRLCLKQ